MFFQNIFYSRQLKTTLTKHGIVQKRTPALSIALSIAAPRAITP